MRTLLKKMVLGCTMLAFAAPATMAQMPMDPSYNYAQNKSAKKQMKVEKKYQKKYAKLEKKQMKKQAKLEKKQMKKQHKLEKKAMKRGYQSPNQTLPSSLHNHDEIGTGQIPMNDGLPNDGVHNMAVGNSEY